MTVRNVLSASVVACVGVAFAAGCRDTSAPPGTESPAVVKVSQQYVPGSIYIEGSYSYVRVERDGAEDRVVRLSSERTPRATLRLEPGSYRLVSFQRPCDGNCGTLDPPTDRCSLSLELEANDVENAVVRLSPGKGCTFDSG